MLRPGAGFSYWQLRRGTTEFLLTMAETSQIRPPSTLSETEPSVVRARFLARWNHRLGSMFKHPKSHRVPARRARFWATGGQPTHFTRPAILMVFTRCHLYRPRPMRQGNEPRTGSDRWAPSGAATAWVVTVAVAVAVALVECLAFPVRPAGADSTGASAGNGSISAGASSGATSGPGSSSGTSGGSSGGGATGSAGWSCTSTYLALNNEGGSPAGGPLPGAWYSVTCVEAGGGVQVTQTVWITSSAPAPSPVVDPRTVALRAEQSLQLPRPTLFSSPTGTTVVNLDTWLWIDPSIWHPYSLTASAGPVSATVTARPVGVVWSTGDGQILECNGPGQVFDPSGPSESGCTHRYVHTSLGQSSPSGAADAASFPVTASLWWTVSWTSVGVTGGGVLPSLITTGSMPLRVEQVESVNVSPSASGASPLALGWQA